MMELALLVARTVQSLRQLQPQVHLPPIAMICHDELNPVPVRQSESHPTMFVAVFPTRF